MKTVKSNIVNPTLQHIYESTDKQTHVSRRLELVTLIAETTLSGRLFQMFTMRFENKLASRTESERGFTNFLQLHLIYSTSDNIN